MPNVKKVAINTMVLCELRHRTTRALVPGGSHSPIPDRYFFGHGVTVQVSVEDIQSCRLYWAEKTNVSIVNQQSVAYFIDMYKLEPNANTFTAWNTASLAGGSKVVDVKDIPAMPGGTDRPHEQHRWLEIIAIVHNTTDGTARKAHFRQDLLYFPAGGEQAARQRLVQLGIPLANLTQSGDGVRNYVHTIVQNDAVVANPGIDIPAIFAGAPMQLW